MTSTQFVALGVRLFCIWFAIYLLDAMTSYWVAVSQQPHNGTVVAAVIAAQAVFAAVVVLLWLFPLTVARKLLPRAALGQPVSLPPHEQIERAGFCLLGLWLLTRSIPSLVFETIVSHLYTRPGSTLELRPQDYASIGGNLVELAIALWLLLGARGLRGILHWARTFGSEARSADSNPQE